MNPLILVTYGLGLASATLSTSLYIAHTGKEEVRELLGGTVTRYLMGALLVISAISLIGMVRTREPGQIRIGPDGVQHADIFGVRTVKWDELVDITDTTDKKTRNPIVLLTNDSKPIVVSNADRYGDSGPALYWMVRHYWKHPENRDELTDGRALDRLRNGQFAPE
ncbi:hypothetical protein [Mycobacterium sp. 236(2023)]|uniref:hypothetical protein n=1 Tax=Mycobacterium sp. 236(2023) TaxID=3038163 RepID=UPI0024156A68|nr:hypothetical protein [Mycobacterium sp. 236(2023)]MDG4663390.1 hypothetical protein [Mycobacterium sp. 236(2023)]